MNKTLKEQLTKFGLAEKESAVYLAALELGAGTPMEISKKSGIKRPTTYLILDLLAEKGLVTRSLKERTQVFIAQPPKKILNSLNEQVLDFQSLLPQLMAVHNLEKQKPKIMIFEGDDAPDRAYQDILEYQGEVSFMGITSEVYKKFPKTMKPFEEKIKNKNFSVREILVDEPIAKDYTERNQGPFHQIRFLPKNLKPSGSDFCIYGDKILLTSLQDEIFIVSIEDKKIANFVRILFDLTWQSLK
ncbi:MAG: helix-turn-helix domain-containing protein [Patescibacteria group bacterium]|jgi:sugar-specific transcriptional regulator TrmB